MIRTFAALAIAMAAVIGAVGYNTKTADAQALPFAQPGGPYYGNIYQSITFNGGGSVGTGLGYFWSFGDGTTATGAVVAKSYTTPGTWTVTLTVTDQYGWTNSNQTMATVGQQVGYYNPYDGYNGYYARYYNSYDDCYRYYNRAVVCSWDGSYYGPTYYANTTNYNAIYRWPYRTYCAGGYWAENCGVYYANTTVVPGTVITAPAQRAVVPAPVAPVVSQGQQTPLSFR
ncbi:MAG: PKD domain-containing protein [Dehalococcoidia bacterium]